MLRPLLPLLVALLAAPGCRALSCYQCSDLLTSETAHQTLKELTGARALPPCAQFDDSDDRFKVEECVAPFDEVCTKVVYMNRTVRGCISDRDEGCTRTDQLEECFCKGDYCNSAGLAAPTMLLLLLPAALLAGLVGA